MTPYAQTETFSEGDVADYERVERAVRGLPSKLDGAWVRCHELARAVHGHLHLADRGWAVVDGQHYGGVAPVEHTWLQRGRSVIDLYSVAQVPPVRLVDADFVRGMYLERRPRDDVDEAVVARLAAALAGGGPEAGREAKQVIVVRKDLNMRWGKGVAQGAHASLKALLDWWESGRPQPRAMTSWLRGAFTKVCVSVGSEAELEAVHAAAAAAGLPASLVVDSGRTEFRGVPTKTCCAVGPAWLEEVDPVTRRLPLL